MWNWLRRQTKGKHTFPIAESVQPSSFIAIIYHNQERYRAETVAAPLIIVGYQVAFAPLGLQVGSDLWKLRVSSTLAIFAL